MTPDNEERRPAGNGSGAQKKNHAVPPIVATGSDVRPLNTPHDRAVQLHARVLQDALSEATASFWHRRSQAFLDATPRPGDFTGRATPEDLSAARERCLGAAAACRARASLEAPGAPLDPIVADLLGMSTRAIAPVVGSTSGTVTKDLKRQVLPVEAPERIDPATGEVLGVVA